MPWQTQIIVDTSDPKYARKRCEGHIVCKDLKSSRESLWMWLAESFGTTHENLSDENQQSHPQKHQCLISSTSCCCKDVRDFCFELPESTPCFCRTPSSVLQKCWKDSPKPMFSTFFPHKSINSNKPININLSKDDGENLRRSKVRGARQLNRSQWRDRFFPGGLKGGLIWSFSEDTDAFSIPLSKLLWDMRVFGCTVGIW